ncbi:MAG: phosphoenolpyruvate--protein phosphotransferase [Gammaproteobacteria bacterium]|nr:phosphoenolpyruvate--protein phosphotransferase [Gammaproteobacteria bacterium]
MFSNVEKIIKEVRHANGFDEAVLVLTQRIRETLEADACAIFFYDAPLSQLVMLAMKGYEVKSIDSIRLDVHNGLIGLIATKKEVINLADAQTHSAYYFFPQLGEDKFHGFVGVPIVYKKRLLGLIVAQRETTQAFSDAEESFLITLALHYSQDIAKAEMLGQITQLSYTSTQHHEILLNGSPGSPGVGIGTGYVVFSKADLDAVPDKKIIDIENEIQIFRHAINTIREEIIDLNKRLQSTLAPEDRALFDAYLLMLDDNSLGFEIEQEIHHGNWAQGALRKVIKLHMRQFESMDDPYLRDRAEDILDLGQRILDVLQKREKQIPVDYPEKVILVGENITAADLSEVPLSHLKGIVSRSGSSNAHIAILARSLGVPAIMGVDGLSPSQLESKTVVVDGYYGHVYLDPSDIIIREFNRLTHEEHQLNEELKSLRTLPAETTDGHTVSLFINTGFSSDLGLSLSVGADGVGLYRTEVPFLSRDMFPSSTEQKIIYRQLLNAFSPRSVTMRTLDIGGDKVPDYLSVPEENPFLGWRGIRVSLDHPELFLMQVRAMMRASIGYTNLKIMLPMISHVTQVDDALDLITIAHTGLLEEGLSITMPQIGVMIEVPAAVYQTYVIAKKVNFISVGSNDLTQYLLAVDRNNSRVANLYDNFHPAVLQAFVHIVNEAHRAGVPVSICGEIAGDALAALLLLGIGFDSLSMSASKLLRIKWVIRQCSFQHAKSLVQELLTFPNAAVIRQRLETELQAIGLGGLIRIV